jgi:uncharacterized protein YhfF
VEGISELPITELPIAEFADPGPLRDALVAAILDGTKTATSSLLAEYGIDDEPLPVVGDRYAVVDSAGVRVAVIETTSVRIEALGKVDRAHARAEGGFRSMAVWRATHEEFWRRPEVQDFLDDATFTLDDETPIVLERIRLVASPPVEAAP